MRDLKLSQVTKAYATTNGLSLAAGMATVVDRDGYVVATFKTNEDAAAFIQMKSNQEVEASSKPMAFDCCLALTKLCHNMGISKAELERRLVDEGKVGQGAIIRMTYARVKARPPIEHCATVARHAGMKLSEFIALGETPDVRAKVKI